MWGAVKKKVKKVVNTVVCQQIYRTKGLISEDRSNKATLLLTIPRSLFKSSAKDLSLEILDFGSCSTLEVFLFLGALGRRSDLKGHPILARLRLSRGIYRCFLARILT